MDSARYEALRQNVLDAPSSIVPNQQADAAALIDLLDVRRQQVVSLRLLVPGIAWPVVDGLRTGIRNAPLGVIVYHDRLQLLQLFDAIDLLGDVLAPPAPEPPREIAVEPESPAEDVH